MLLAQKAHTGNQLGALIFVDYAQPAKVEEKTAALQWANLNGYELHCLTIKIEGVDKCMKTGAGVDGLRELPGRNLIMLSQASNVAIAQQCDRLWYGANANDSAYFDCSISFIQSFNACLKASNLQLNLDAPLIRMNKKQIVRQSRQLLGKNFDLAWSCYEPNQGHPCGFCHSCQERRAACYK